jgi:hypothetical protein
MFADEVLTKCVKQQLLCGQGQGPQINLVSETMVFQKVLHSAGHWPNSFVMTKFCLTALALRCIMTCGKLA